MTNSRIEMDQISYKDDSQDGLSIDVAIIGAGVSGLYAGYRLLTGEFSDNIHSPSSVHIFDLDDRIGGRLLSIKLPGTDIIGELGGMRYMTSQKITTTLIEDIFLLNYKSFPLGNPNNHFYYFRKQRFKGNAWDIAQDNNQEFKTHYYLNKDEEGYSPNQLFNKIIYDVLTDDPWFIEKYGDSVKIINKYTYEFKIRSRQWDDIKINLSYYKKNSPYNGMKVREIGFWNLIKDRIGQEGYSFLADCGGYFSNTINWNAAEAMPYMVGDFSSDNVEYRTIENGYDQLAYALAKNYNETKGSQLWMKNQLVTFKKDSNGKRNYALNFWNKKGKYYWTVYTDKIILAMPRWSLKLLDQENFFFDKTKENKLQSNIDSVFSEPSFKLLMGFEYPWWIKDFGATAGESITDLPIRQCYYFGTDPKNSHSLFLGSYNDMRTVTFWTPLLQQKYHQSFKFDDINPDNKYLQKFKPHSTKLVSKEKIEQISVPGNEASKNLVDEAISQVEELHGIKIPPPYIARIKDWSQDPYGGGYHAWHAGIHVNEVMPYMRRPICDESIHIIGEAYSSQQGWTEGAFCVTENLLQEWFNLKRPHWLADDYYLGW
ncbi:MULTISPECIES: flavin monoamine oxidase family protein [Photorhabdus]|uniref:Tryptophan 2-monooxygenase n=2 Tax=Photorhabdus TaxID=29487 RepID=A0ABX0B4I0_9GAMM|nr:MULTISPECIES: FAD-dependent oxidoreductase [Photorhabdus]MCC8373518.1 FAD-dependent oxidoreductase [Photorhabdus bodei]MCC8464841.1 FAD-dependent oxidoreductase [Photorhabdus bodei]MCT8350523.1 FAD-dependent oxidoreductase [Photorhabdus kayaii]MDB6366601.1 FAD-dependent oxidoreductase [Photorhabdus bodei]MDB6372666.1 FAD-dependent oxidoreductase [Photorhabdus bodei]